MLLKLNLQAFRPDVILPRRETKRSAGYDIFCPMNVTIPPRSGLNIDLGFTWDPQWEPWPGFHDAGLDGVFAKVFDKSGLAYKCKFGTLAGVIDLDYARRNLKPDQKLEDAEWKLICMNHSDTLITFEKGQKIAQFVLMPYIVADDEDTSNTDKIRTGGLGSTGK